MNKFLENIFSVKNKKFNKVVTILGIKFSFKSKRAKRKYLLRKKQKKYMLSKDAFKIYSHAVKFQPLGHFYSPVPSIEDSRLYICNKEKDIPKSINLNYDEQIELLDKFKDMYDMNCFAVRKNDLNKVKGNSRFHHRDGNIMFRYADAFTLSLFLRHFKPKNIVEIGCGFSSAVMLDTKDMYLKDENINFTYIEPYPDRLLNLIKPEDNINLIQQKLQDVDYNLICNNLNYGDLLFIDSTHVLKYNSDVMYIFNKILPNLKQGVFVHFHDILFPFEYPDIWIDQGRLWNEAFYLKQFLSYNNDWKIKLWVNAIYAKNPDYIKQNFPLFDKKIGGSIYLMKVSN